MDDLADLDILAEEPVKIGKLGENVIAVFPASLARYKEVARLIYEHDSEAIDLRQKLLNMNLRNASEEELKELSERSMRKIMDDIDALAPIIVKMLERPRGNYEWADSPVSADDVIQRLSGKTVARIIDTWLSTSAVPATLKKVNLIGQ